MTRVAMIFAILVSAALAFAQASGTQSQNPPAGAQPGATGQQGSAGQTPGTPAQPAGKRPPQAKTQPEFDAYKVAAATTDPAGMEKAANDFAAKFPDSELRVLLYKSATRLYQNANNADKMQEMARKVLELEPNDPESLIAVAEVLTERTRDTDLDKDQKLAEAKEDIDKALKAIDTDVPAGVPPDKVDMYRNLVRSNAYSIMGTLEFNKNNFPAAESAFRKSIDALPQQPDPITVLRLAIALDKQDKYADAMTYANQAVQLTPENSNAGTLARRERDRLAQLTNKPGASGTATNPPAQNTSAPPKQ
jgi:tetratricopeptide (TPR) repeat protein